MLLTLVYNIGWLFNRHEVSDEFAITQLFIFIHFGVFILGGTFGFGEMMNEPWIDKLFEFDEFQVIKSYFLPFLIVSSMCLLEEIYIWGTVRRLQLTGGEIESGFLLKHLLVTGIIPMRIIFALHPPITKENFMLGFLSIGYFVYSIVMLANELAGW